MTGRVALVTCGQLPALDDDDRLVIPPLATRGITVASAVWADPAVDWAGMDLAVIRSTWDYPRRRREFLQWARRIPRLANPADVVAWNTDKRYLSALARAGLPVIPTSWLIPDKPRWRPAPEGEWVVKPAVGAGSLDAGRYRLDNAAQYELAVAHVERLTTSGRVAMVQPYLPAVEGHGETAVMYIGGRFSHAIRKGPMLSGPEALVDGLYKPEDVTPRVPTEAERALADRAIAAVPGGAERLLYGRVDLIPDQDGSPLLIELELTEPSLFLGHGPGAPDRLADAIASRLTPR